MPPQSVSDQGRSSSAASRMPRGWLTPWWVLGALLLGAGIGWLAIYAGVYDIAADNPHTQPVYWLLQTIRQRSITARAADVVPIDLADPKRIASGATQYGEMCSGCHLAPGMKRTEISRGLYPRAPELRRGSSLTPAEISGSSSTELS
jgi:hypothetical protein